MTNKDNQSRGFGNMSEEERKEAARKGGQHSHGGINQSRNAASGKTAPRPSDNKPDFEAMDEEEECESSKVGKSAHKKSTC